MLTLFGHSVETVARDWVGVSSNCIMGLNQLRNFDTTRSKSKNQNTVKQRPVRIIWQGRYQDTPALNEGESGGAGIVYPI